MSTPLRTLILEDQQDDVDLMLRALRRAGFEVDWRHAVDEASFSAGLGADLDIILADFALPGFDALRALERLQRSGLDIPFVIVSGTIGEELAVEAMRKGATNYLLKDRLGRLGTEVAQALEAKRLRDEVTRAEEALRESAALNEAVLDSLTAHIAVLDPQSRIVTTNEVWQQGRRVNRHPLLSAGVGAKYIKLLEGLSRKDEGARKVLEGFLEVLQGSRTHFRAEYPCSLDDGEYCFLMTVTPLGGGGGGTVVAFEDITERKRYEAEIQFLAYHDPLTRLANRRRFREQFELELSQAERYGEPLTVFFFDLDRFKAVNDTFGHDSGDAVLRQAVERITAEIRSSDILARLGGDEFAALLHKTDAESSVALAKRIVERFRAPFNARGNPAHIGVSIGIASYPKDAATIDTLLSHADLAAYRAKSASLGFCLHDEAEHRSTRERLNIESELRGALAENALEMNYQSVVDLEGMRRVGVEALVRWRHPEWGDVAPSDFLPVADESGLMGALDAWVLRRVLRDVQVWGDTPTPLWVGVNLSQRSFRSPEVMDTFVSEIGASPFDASRLMLEITESSTIGEPAGTLRTLQRLKALGVRIAVDDFGTGYSSLAYLKDLPVDYLKIDGEFVRAIGEGGSSERIVRTIIDLAHNLELSALAEGVETEAQLAWLMENGCDFAQGYLLGHPARAEELFEGSGGTTFQEV